LTQAKIRFFLRAALSAWRLRIIGLADPQDLVVANAAKEAL